MAVSALIKITLRLIKCTQNWYTDVKNRLINPWMLSNWFESFWLIDVQVCIRNLCQKSGLVGEEVAVRIRRIPIETSLILLILDLKPLRT